MYCSLTQSNISSLYKTWSFWKLKCLLFHNSTLLAVKHLGSKETPNQLMESFFHLIIISSKNSLPFSSTLNLKSTRPLAQQLSWEFPSLFPLVGATASWKPYGKHSVTINHVKQLPCLKSLCVHFNYQFYRFFCGFLLCLNVFDCALHIVFAILFWVMDSL